MQRGHSDWNASAPAGEQAADRAGYSANHVLGVVDTEEAAARAVEALAAGGFLDAEVHVVAGQREADAMHARAGRAGPADLASRVAGRLGAPGDQDQLEVKARYEQALRDGHLLLLVEAPTGARRDRAAQILREHGAHTMNYIGHFGRAELIPPPAPERGA
jgi:hypothetical protein